MTATASPLSLAALQELSREPALAASQLRSLLATLAEPDEEQRAWASDCLEQVEAPAISDVEPIATLCMHENAAMASWACKLMGRTGNAQFEKLLAQTVAEHASTVVRQQAALALQHFVPLSTSTKQALSQAAKSNDERLQRLATQALEKT